MEKNKTKEEIMLLKYLNNPDKFCLIYRNFTLVKNRLKITNFVKNVCHTYLGVKSAEQDQTWAPYTVRGDCNSTFLGEMGKRRKIFRIWFFY